MGEGPVQISHGGSQGFKSPHLHPQPRRSERRQRRAGDAHCMFRPRCGRKLKSQSSREALRDARGLGPRPHHDHTAWSPPAADRRAILARIPPLPVGHPVDRAHCPTTAPRRRPSRSRPRRWPSTTFPSLEGQAPTWGRRRAMVDTAGDHADPGHPSRAAAGPTATPHDLIPVGHYGRRRPDTGHLDAQTPAPDTGHRTGTRTR
jgi:hypothetical protein